MIARGDLKATQKLLGHLSASTTADIDVDWNIDQLANALHDMREERKSESFPPAVPQPA